MYPLLRFSAVACLLGAIAILPACAMPQSGSAPPGASAVAPPSSQSPLKTALTDASKAAAVIHTVAGDISAPIAAACNVSAPVLKSLNLQGGAANTAASVLAGCTVEGQINMTLNDLAPPSDGNSGNSQAWVTDTTAALQIAAAVAPTAALQ